MRARSQLVSVPAPSLIMEPPNPSLERTHVSVVDVRLTPSLTCAGARAAQLSRSASKGEN